MISTEDITMTNAKSWLTENFDETTKQQVQALINNGGDELVDSFYKDLEFGTGGMRGIMGVGTNRMNKYTLGMATQGLSDYLKKQFKDVDQIKVAIAYDCRINSKEFARLVAEVFSANGIKVFLFEDLRPTPELSFAIRHLGCQGGVVLTASHNPKEYNGYKVYFDDGAQLVPPHDKYVIDLVRQTKVEDIQFNGNDELIEYIGEEVDQAFFKAVVDHSLIKEGKDDIKIIFTSLHGTSIKAVPQVLKLGGFNHVHIVEEQAVVSGVFPTVKSPNPEEPEALEMAIKLANETGADLVIGTDPDADRIGIGVRDLNGKLILLNGNQTAVMLSWFLMTMWKKQGKLTGKEYIAETIVTTNLIEDIAKSFGVKTYFCLTGFKWIAGIIRELEGKETFISGGEESYGYMIGDFVRDKDSVTCALVVAEIVAWAKAKGSSFYQELIQVYQEHGFYKERLISIVKKGKEGADIIKQMMEDFRENTPTEIDGKKVVMTKDFRSGITKNLIHNTEETINIPSSNVFQFFLEDGSKISARPSGTEPKIKFYYSVKTTLDRTDEFDQKNDELEAKMDGITKALGLN